MLIVAWLYKEFFATQDEFLNRYNEFVLSNGAIGFLFVGFLISILSPYTLIIKLLFMSIFLALPLGQLLVDIGP